MRAQPLALRAAWAAAALSCMPPLPERPIERALVRDVQRIVDVRQQVGWLIDEVELQQVLPDALKSACRVADADRSAALGWLDRRIADEGGPVERAFVERGRDLSRVRTLLLLTRTRLLLGRADAWVRAGKCPFWLSPGEVFDGVHVTSRRLVLVLDGGGRVIEELSRGKVRWGGGGEGRFMVGYGFGERLSAYAGIELGGGARFANLRLGEQREIPSLVGIAALPLALRYDIGLSTYLELEAGPMTYVNELGETAEGRLSGRFDPGARVGFAVGGMYLRLTRPVIPTVSFGILVDHVPGRSGQPRVTQISVGARTGISFSPPW